MYSAYPGPGGMGYSHGPMRFGTYFFLQAPPSLAHPDVVRNEIEQMAWTEELGFDSIWLTEHHFIEYGLSVSPAVLAAAAAMRTRHVRIGLAAAILPFHDPIRLAEELAMVDILSGGRLDVGVGRGNRPVEFEGYRIPQIESRDRFEESLEIMIRAWTRERFAFEGRHFTIPEVRVIPKPLQQPHPPLWIGGSSPAALRRAAAFAQVWQPTPTPLAELIERQAYLRQACDKIGRQDVPETRMSFRVDFSAITGNTIPSGVGRPTGQGTPRQVAEDIRRYRHEAGLEAFQINFNGCHSLEQLLASMDCFMHEVKPLVEPE
jgi:probable F420-dependent oxidoreductase